MPRMIIASPPSRRRNRTYVQGTSRLRQRKAEGPGGRRLTAIALHPRSLLESGRDLVGQLHRVVDVLDVVALFELVDEPQHLLGVCDRDHGRC